jgi:hypothetical protein
MRLRDEREPKRPREVWVRNQWEREYKEIRRKKKQRECEKKKEKGNILCIFRNCYSQIILSILLLDNNNRK